MSYYTTLDKKKQLQTDKSFSPLTDIPLWLQSIGKSAGDYFSGFNPTYRVTRPYDTSQIYAPNTPSIPQPQTDVPLWKMPLKQSPLDIFKNPFYPDTPEKQMAWEQPQEVPPWDYFNWRKQEERKKYQPTEAELYAMRQEQSKLESEGAWGRIKQLTGFAELSPFDEEGKYHPLEASLGLGELYGGSATKGLKLAQAIKEMFMGSMKLGAAEAKSANIIDRMADLMRKGAEPDDIFKVLTETAQAGRKFKVPEAENLIKTAEAKVAQLGKVAPEVKGGVIGLSGVDKITENLMVGELETKIDSLSSKGFQNLYHNFAQTYVDDLVKNGTNRNWAKATVDSVFKEKGLLPGVTKGAQGLSAYEYKQEVFNITKTRVEEDIAKGIVERGKTKYIGEEIFGDERFRSMFSTGTRYSLKKGETWESKAQVLLDSLKREVDEVTKGVEALPSEAQRAFKGAGGTIPPKVPPNVAQQIGNIPPGDTGFLEYLKNIVKPSRKTFEAGESAQRSRQAAAYKSAFEAAGGGEKGHLAGRAAQKGALKPSVEPFNAPQGWWDNHVNTMDQFQLVDGLGKPKPIGFDNATMKGAFLRLKQGVLPQPMELEFMEQYFGKGSMDALKKLIKPSWTEYPITWFYNSILSGPKTQIVNFGSNTLRGILSPFESATAALIEAPLAFVQGRPRERFFGEAAQELFGLIRGLPEGSRAFVNTFISGKSLGKWELQGQVMKGNKWLPITWPTRLLEAADAFGFAIHSATSIRTQAFRIASAEKLKGQVFLDRLNQLVGNPTADMMATAEKIADYRLFRQKPGEVIGKLIEMRNQAWPIRFLVPFLRTPANLVKYGLELSPLGILNPKLWKNIAKKSPEAAEQIGRWIIGSGIAVSLGIYAADGNITGAAPVDPSKRDAFYRAGKQPFSLKIGDMWVSYQRLEPFNQLLSQVAAVVDSIQEGKTTKDAFEIAQGVISTIGSNLISQTYMENIANVMNFIEDPFGEGKRLLQRTASGFVPESALLRTIAQALDPTIRQAQNIPEQIMAGIPGLTEQARAKTNVFGASQKSETPPYSPINISSEKNDPVNIELDRLGINVGLVGGTISFTNSSGKSEKLVLTGDELYNYRNLSGQAIKKALDKAVMSAAYRRLQTDERRESYLNNVISDARQDAREMQLNNSGIPTPDRQERLQRLAAEEILQPYFEIEDEMWRGQEQLRQISEEIKKLKNSSNPRDKLRGAQMEMKNPRIVFIREQIVMKQQMMLSNPKIYAAMEIYRGR